MSDYNITDLLSPAFLGRRAQVLIFHWQRLYLRLPACFQQAYFFRWNRYNGNQTKIPCPFSQGEFRVYISRLQFAGHIDDFRKYCTGISNQQSPCRERRIPHFGYSRKAEYQRYSKQISLSGIRRTKTALCLCKSNYQQPEALTGR